MSTRSLLVVIVAALLLLHQDFWFWSTARPLVFGFLPVGLAYHAGYCLAAALLMWLLTSVAWPHHLESAERSRSTPHTDRAPAARARRRRGAPRSGAAERM